MHDVIVDALGRIDAAEEAAAFDRPVKYGRWGPSPWTIDSEIIGTVKQGDIPQMITDELAKAAIVPGGIKAITTALNLATSKSLKDYAAGTYKMPYTTGQRFVRYLEERTKKSGAATAATVTAPEQSEAMEKAASPVIIPQEDGRNDDTARLAQQVDVLRTQLNGTTAALSTRTTELDKKTQECAELRAQLKTVGEKGDEAEAKVEELQQQVEDLRHQLDLYRQDDERTGGPARIAELEDQYDALVQKRMEDLELIRDLTRMMMVTRGAC